MRNLEIKVKIEHGDEIRDRLSFAKHYGTREQVDTYYLLGERRLKIREEKTGSEIILYMRKLENGTRESTYYRIVIPQRFLKFMKSTLRFLCGTKVIVEKVRDLYTYKNTRIHLDIVAHLGVFIELETVIRAGKDDGRYVEEHEDIKQMLSLSTYSTIAGSYSDLLSK